MKRPTRYRVMPPEPHRLPSEFPLVDDAFLQHPGDFYNVDSEQDRYLLRLILTHYGVRAIRHLHANGRLGNTEDYKTLVALLKLEEGCDDHR